MTEQRAADKFSLRTKVVVGIPAATLMGGFILWNHDLYITVVAFLTLPVAVAFPVLYATLKWKETILGRALMTKARAVALLYLVGLFGAWWPPYPYHGYLMALVTTYLAIAITFQFVVMVRIKLRAIDEEQARIHSLRETT